MSEATASLERLYRETGPRLLAYLRRSFVDGPTAEDLLHETFVQAARQPHRLAAAASPQAWLFAVARHLAVTALRRRRATQPVPLHLAAPPAEPDSRHEVVRQAIAELPPAIRETLELRLRDELSYEEIAAVLSIPIGTVRSRLHHAVQRLRAATQDSQ